MARCQLRKQLATVAVDAVCLFALAAPAWAAAASPTPVGVAKPLATVQASPPQTLEQQGAYLARVGDCIACHTAPGGKAFAGGLPIKLPLGIGTVYSPNITPDKTTGIGQYSFADFERVMRKGEAPHGKWLYPAMPYPSYAHVDTPDLRALYAYFMQGVAPVQQANRPSTVPWPLDMRWPLAIWSWLFRPDHPFRPDPHETVIWNRGAYLVEGLGHCGACHTPRGLFLQEKALSPFGKNGDLYVSGARVDEWYAANLRGNMRDGLGRFTAQQVEQILKEGRDAGFTVVGSMTAVIKHSTQYMTDGDRMAIVTFLKSLSPRPLPVVPSSLTAAQDEQAMQRGKGLYATHCAMCHQVSGQGIPNVFPALARNPTINTPDPLDMVHMMLAGGHTVQTMKLPQALAMPSLGGGLSNQQIADIATYVRASWGNQAAPVDPDTVARLRAKVLPGSAKAAPG
jgi:mono/diheme cytochrome c family protein